MSAGSPVVRPLLENFRRNDVLTSFASALLSGRGSRCSDDRVAGRRLRFAAKWAASDLVAACLDPAFPLVFVLLKGACATSENRVEAGLVPSAGPG